MVSGQLAVSELVCGSVARSPARPGPVMAGMATESQQENVRLSDDIFRYFNVTLTSA